MSTTPKFFTEDDLLRMPDDGNRYELVRGELRQMSPTGFDHGRCTGKLHHLLSSHILERALGYVLAAETGFVLERTADGRSTVRAADIAFVAAGRIPPGVDTTRYLAMPLDLVVETLSPSDTAQEVEEKIADWLEAGVRVALTVNPASRSVTLYRSATKITRLGDGDELDVSDVVAGFRCQVSAIFD
jgi:Uma2 family endonuclease